MHRKIKFLFVIIFSSTLLCIPAITTKLLYASQIMICPTSGPGQKTIHLGTCYLASPAPPNPTQKPTSVIPLPTPSKKIPPPTGEHTLCKGTIVSFGIQKTLIPIRPWHGRPGFCMVPRTIVLHITTTSETPEQTRDYFAAGAGGRGSSAQFIIGRDGRGLQITETLADKAEVAYGVAGYIDDISIEMESTQLYASKTSAPAAQYTTVLALVKSLMRQYNIPLGNLQYTWEDHLYPLGGNPNLPKGVYGHYQLNPPPHRTDPGAGWLCDLRNDLGAHQICKHVQIL